jgi:broad specificity phosphatase PhoE
MKHLLLVKHSLPEIIPTVPARQWKLSKVGQDRCRSLAEKIDLYLPDIVISSVEPKAVETGQILAGHLDKPFRTFEGLHEHDRAGVEFLDRERFESQVHDFFEHPDELVMGQETANQARERFAHALASVEMEYPQKNIVVVAHGTVITLFVEKMTGTDPFPFWSKLDVPSFVVFSLPEYKLLTTVESVV